MENKNPQHQNEALSLGHESRLDNQLLNNAEQAQKDWEAKQDAFEAYEQSNDKITKLLGSSQEGFALHTQRKASVDFFSKTDVPLYDAEVGSYLATIPPTIRGRELAEDPHAVALVTRTMQAEKDAKNEMSLAISNSKIKGSYTMKDKRLSSDISVEDVQDKNDKETNVRGLGKKTIGKNVFASMIPQLSKYGETTEEKSTEEPDMSVWAEGMSKNNPDEKFAPTGANPEEIPVEKKSTESETDVDMSYVEMATGVPYGSLSKKEEEGVDTRYVDMALGNSSAVPENKTPEIKPTEAQDASRWAEGMSKNNPDEKFAPTGANPEEVVVEKKPTDEEIEAARKLKELNDFKKIAAEYTANDDIVRPMNGDVQPVKEIVSYLQESAPLSQEIKKPEDSTETIEKKRRFTPEEYAAQIEIWKKSIEGSEKAVENAEKALQESREKSKKNLEAMGLTKVGKGLEAFKNMSGKKKLLLGIALAGLSVITGGATSFISTGLSALTFGLRDFDKEKAKAQERGEATTKGTMLKSAVTGLVLALGTGALFHLAGDAMSAASQQFSPMMDSIKHFFSPDHAIASTPDITPGIASTPDIAPPTPPVPSVTPDAGITGSTPDAIMGALPSLPTDYVIQPGDNLTNIIRERIFTSADATSGFNELSHAQQENVIQNFVQSGAFPNPDHIVAGATLDLNSIRDSILQGSVNGEALISHAATLDSASIADNIRNGMSDAVATGEPSVATSIPSSTEVDLGAVATEANGATSFVSEPTVNMDAQPTTVYTSAPTVAMSPEGSVLLDGSGNQVLDGSGNPVRLTNYEGGIGSFGDTQFTSALNSGASPVSPEFNKYLQDNWNNYDKITNEDILKIKGSLLNQIRNGSDEHLKSFFEGKQPGDLGLNMRPDSTITLNVPTGGSISNGASFGPSGLVKPELFANGIRTAPRL